MSSSKRARGCGEAAEDDGQGHRHGQGQDDDGAAIYSLLSELAISERLLREDMLQLQHAAAQAEPVPLLEQLLVLAMQVQAKLLR